MEDSFLCVVCMERFSRELERKPKYLNCHHFYCVRCIQGLLQSDVQDLFRDRITCPMCRQITHVNEMETQLENPIVDPVRVDNALYTNWDVLEMIDYFELENIPNNQAPNQVQLPQQQPEIQQQQHQEEGGMDDHEEDQDEDEDEDEDDDDDDQDQDTETSTDEEPEEIFDESSEESNSGSNKKRGKGFRRMLNGFKSDGKRRKIKRGKRKRNYEKDIFLCSKPSHLEVPNTTQHHAMKKAGLGLKTSIVFDERESSKEIKSKIKSIFPRLKKVPFHYCQRRGGNSAKLEEKYYQTPDGKELKSMKKTIYLVPIKNILDFPPPEGKKLKCNSCSRKIPSNKWREHISNNCFDPPAERPTRRNQYQHQ